MDSTPPLKQHKRQPRRGQTLAEFAITLPILLIMIFGIIEFGRLFQAWVSLQNSARAAARFASTGNINYDIFIPDDPGTAEGSRPLDIRVLETIVPCSPNDDGGNDLGSKGVYADTTTYEGPDGFFATWYDGTDCDPSNEEHQQLRKDLLRLASVMYEARESVNALSAEFETPDVHYFERLNANDTKFLLYDIWKDPLPREDVREWFNVTICSSRPLMNEFSKRIHPTLGAGARFITVRSSSDVVGLPTGTKVDYPQPYCMLNEIPPTDITVALNNSGKRWLDAGGAGDRVTIAVTFNHPLITPLRTGVENYLTMQARRSIVNESFRAPKAIGVFQRSLPPGNSGNTGAQLTATTAATATATATTANPPTATDTATATREPFKCENVLVSFPPSPFNGRNIYMLTLNNNSEQIELMQVTLGWNDIPSPHNNMYLQYMAMGDNIHWSGEPANMNNSVANYTSVDTGQLVEGYRLIPAQGNAIWEGVFASGPSSLADYMTIYDFSAEFTFYAAAVNQTCKIKLVNPPGGEPTEPPTATIGPAPSNTPTCVAATDLVKFAFGGFDALGGVYFNFTNNSGRDLIMTGFRFYWPDAKHPQIIGEPGAGYRLKKVIVGGESVTASEGEPVWKGDVVQGNTSTNQTTFNNPTFGGNTNGQGAAVGQWIADGTIPAGITRIWLDFDSFGGKLSDFGARDYHFNNPKFYFACRGSSPGNGGPGDSDEGELEITIPPPAPTNTPRATRTPGPTFTPLAASPTRTASPVRTQPPATATLTPPAATLKPSRTPLGVSTPPPAGGGE